MCNIYMYFGFVLYFCSTSSLLDCVFDFRLLLLGKFTSCTCAARLAKEQAKRDNECIIF